MVSLLLAALALSLPQTPAAPTAAQHTLTGQVVDGRGEPVPLAEVWVTPWGADDEVLARTRTDGQGTFVLGRVPERRAWAVHAQADGTTHETDHLSPADLIASLRLSDAGSVRGTFADAEGKPVAGAQVVAAFDLARGSRRPVTTVTDAEGRFELARVPLGIVDVRACKEGQGFGAGRVHVTGAVTVTGVPDDVATRPRVRLTPYHEGSPQTFPGAMLEGKFGLDGTWRSAGLPDWEYLVRVSLDGFVIAPVEQRIRPGEPHRVTFRAAPVSTQAWSGTLVGADGKPLAGMLLALRALHARGRAEATSDQDGRFTFVCPFGADVKCVAEALDGAWTLTQPKGEAHIGSRELRYLKWHETTVDLATPLQLCAIAAARVAGRIVADDGRAVPFARVELEHEMSNRIPRWMSFASATADRDGRYEVTGLHPFGDPVRVHVAGSRGAADSEPFSLANAGAVSVPDLKLQPAGVVEGTVLDANGKPVAGARVWLRTWDFATGQQKDGSVFEAITDRRGHYRHAGVEPGGHWLHWTLEAESPPVGTIDAFEVAPGERKTVDLR
jgi:protocatechuate 3,4-dioxygenase beta subunit